MPYLHRVVAEHAGLIANVDLGDFLYPAEWVYDLLHDAVVVTKNEVDLLAADLLSVCCCDLRAADTEVTEEVEFVVGVY
jgi:hypothetical protein